MTSKILAVILSLILPFLSRSQKVIDSISIESCDCMEKVLEKMKIPSEDSLTNCITVAILSHTSALSKQKKLDPNTVEGIREIHDRVRKSLQKKCKVFK